MVYQLKWSKRRTEVGTHVKFTADNKWHKGVIERILAPVGYWIRDENGKLWEQVWQVNIYDCDDDCETCVSRFKCWTNR